MDSKSFYYGTLIGCFFGSIYKNWISSLCYMIFLVSCIIYMTIRDANEGESEQ